METTSSRAAFGRSRTCRRDSDALRVLENYWTKTGGFRCILMLAHDWADWEATKRSYELFARYAIFGQERQPLTRS